MTHLGQNRNRLALNGTNLGLLKDQFAVHFDSHLCPNLDIPGQTCHQYI